MSLRALGPLLVYTALLGSLISCGGHSTASFGASSSPNTETQALSQSEATSAAPQIGIVTAVIPGESFTLRTGAQQTRIFQMDATTHVQGLAKWGTTTLRGLEVGQRVRVSATPGTDGTLLARQVACLAFPGSISPRKTSGVDEPVARIYHQSAYRDRSDEMFVFAGQSGPSWTNEVKDMWSYHVGTDRWQYLGEQPAAVANSYNLVYDRSADRIVVYVTMDGDGNILETPETWAFDPVTHEWENRHALNPPSTRWGTMMAYDVHARKTVLFAGGDFNTWLPLNDTWTYDYASNTWTQLETADSPPRINFGAMAYDRSSRLIVLFSGNHWYDYTFEGWNIDETWTLDVPQATWKRVSTTFAPPPRTYHRMVYDSWRGEMLMFGGCTGIDLPDDPLIPQNDIWAFHTRTGTWRQLDAGNAPGPRGWHTMEFSSDSGRAVVFGGGASREEPTHSTWIYSTMPDRWRKVLD